MKYVEDPLWNDAINRNECPYDDCKGDITKKGIKRQCSKCDLIIYGNPQFLAYKRNNKEVKTSKEKEWIDACSHKHVFFDKLRVEKVCLDCGLVIAGRPHYIAGSLKVEFPEGYIFEDVNTPL